MQQYKKASEWIAKSPKTKKEIWRFIRICLVGIVLILFGLNANIGFAQTSVDLRAWTEVDYIGNGSAGDWQVAADGLSLTQYINGAPTYFISDFDFIDSRFSGSFRVNTTNDDDFIGFVFGFQGLDENLGYYLFCWKKKDQSLPSGLAEEGFKLLKIQGIPNDLPTDAYVHGELADGENSENIKVLASLLGSGKGWESNRDYTFQLSYRANGNMRVLIVDKETETILWNTDVISDPQSFGTGRIGFFNASQENVTYAGFTQAIMQPPVAAPGGPYLVEETAASMTVDASGSSDPDGYTSGFGAIVSVQWDLGNDGIADDQGRTHSTENFTRAQLLAKRLAPGIDVPIALTVTDEDGLTGRAVGIIRYKGVAPTTNFKASIVSGTAPLTVQFTDSSTGWPTSWKWDFNNDNIVDATEQRPSFTYQTAGTYSVKLIAINAFGQDEELKTNYITVTQPPLPDLLVTQVTWNPTTNLVSDQEVTLTAEIKNAGVAATTKPFTVDFRIDGQSIGTQSVGQSLPVGSSAKVSQTWKAVYGNHNLSVVVDNKGEIQETNESNNTLTKTLPTVKDIVPPETNIISNTPMPGKICDITFIKICWSGTDNRTPSTSLQYSYKLDTAAWSAWTTETCHQYTGLSAGLKLFQVRAKDADGNIDATPAELPFSVDATTPVISNIQIAPGQSSAVITWESSEPSSSVVKYGVTTSYGSQVEGTVIDASQNKATLTGMTPGTLYHFMIGMNDGCHESFSSDQTVQTTAIQPPDLVIGGMKAPNVSGYLTAFEVGWNARNDGNGDAKGAWKDRLYLSTDETLEISDVFLGEFDRPQELTAGFDYTQTQTISIPKTTPGIYYLIVQADGSGALNESKEDDNTAAQKISIMIPKILTAAPDVIPLNVYQGVPVKGTITLTNLVTANLSGLTATVKDAPANVTIQATPPATLNSGATATMNYTITANAGSDGASTATVVLTGSNDAEASVTFELTVIPEKAKLVAAPGYVETGMLRGAQRTITFEVTNSGGLPAENLEVMLPNAAWLKLATPKAIGTLAPSAKTQIGLILTPPSDMQLGPYSGNIGIVGSNVQLTVGFKFIAVSEAKGSLKVTAKDEFSYFAQDHPNLAGAAVTLKDTNTDTIIAQGVTDASGVFTTGSINEGRYALEVKADKHSAYNATIEIAPGTVTEEEAFLSRQLVTYNWVVEPVEIQDNYNVTIEAVFETHVPAPVVTIDPPYLFFPLWKGETTTLDVTITNHGLIAANNVALVFPENDQIYIEPLIREIGTLPAETSIVVPVRVRAKEDGPIQMLSLAKNLQRNASDTSSQIGNG